MRGGGAPRDRKTPEAEFNVNHWFPASIQLIVSDVTLATAAMALTGDGPAIEAGLESDVALAARRDRSAFERLYRRHVPRIHGLARRMLGSSDADEVTQDIFVRTWQKLGQFRGDSAFGTWLHRLAVNVVIERRRWYASQRA